MATNIAPAAPADTSPNIDRNGVAKRRRTDQHGLPIATVTVKLLALTRSRRVSTVGQVAQMLEHEYKRMNVTPPHARNLNGLAAGILDAVRVEPRELRAPARAKTPK